MKIPYYTTASGALAAAQAIGVLKEGALEVRPLQSYGEARAARARTASPAKADVAI